MMGGEGLSITGVGNRVEKPFLIVRGVRASRGRVLFFHPNQLAIQQGRGGTVVLFDTDRVTVMH